VSTKLHTTTPVCHQPRSSVALPDYTVNQAMTTRRQLPCFNLLPSRKTNHVPTMVGLILLMTVWVGLLGTVMAFQRPTSSSLSVPVRPGRIDPSTSPYYGRRHSSWLLSSSLSPLDDLNSINNNWDTMAKQLDMLTSNTVNPDVVVANVLQKLPPLPSLPTNAEIANYLDQLSRMIPDIGQLFPTLPPNLELPQTPAWSVAIPGGGNALDVLAMLTALSQSFAALPLTGKVLVVALPLMLADLAFLYALSFPPSNYRAGMEPYPRGQYDPIQADAYYARRPVLVLQRCLNLLRLSNSFLWHLLLDKYVTKREEENRPQRAKELLTLITQLGPTAIKVGQALSVRPDLIPTEYATALASLQDQVPPFDADSAKRVLLEQLGTARYQQLQLPTLSQGPIASASIGQVYKGWYEPKDSKNSNSSKDDTSQKIEVAVKVQRPNVLAEIALDLYIVRKFAPIYQKITGSATDLPGLANEWGRGFIAELDYRTEAINTMAFNQAMQERQLNAVCAPTVIPSLSTEQILVTEWVQGTRLDQSNADDIPRLCSVALNAYLVMLLELQTLHCDPHPGNLLRTTDGRLCILDFGMTLDIEPDLQYALLEYVAHLTAEEYDALPLDLCRLGFLKPEKLEFAQRSGVLEPLKYFLKQAGKGGGANGVRDRIFAEYRAKYPGKDDDELRIEMRAEMKVRSRVHSTVTWNLVFWRVPVRAVLLTFVCVSVALFDHAQQSSLFFFPSPFLDVLIIIIGTHGRDCTTGKCCHGYHGGSGRIAKTQSRCLSNSRMVLVHIPGLFNVGGCQFASRSQLQHYQIVFPVHCQTFGSR